MQKFNLPIFKNILRSNPTCVSKKIADLSEFNESNNSIYKSATQIGINLKFSL